MKALAVALLAMAAALNTLGSPLPDPVAENDSTMITRRETFTGLDDKSAPIKPRGRGQYSDAPEPDLKPRGRGQYSDAPEPDL